MFLAGYVCPLGVCGEKVHELSGWNSFAEHAEENGLLMPGWIVSKVFKHGQKSILVLLTNLLIPLQAQSSLHLSKTANIRAVTAKLRDGTTRTYSSWRRASASRRVLLGSVLLDLPQLLILHACAIKAVPIPLEILILLSIGMILFIKIGGLFSL